MHSLHCKCGFGHSGSISPSRDRRLEIIWRAAKFFRKQNTRSLPQPGSVIRNSSAVLLARLASAALRRFPASSSREICRSAVLRLDVR
jgi:hypothetical protein